MGLLNKVKSMQKRSILKNKKAIGRKKTPKIIKKENLPNRMLNVKELAKQINEEREKIKVSIKNHHKITNPNKKRMNTGIEGLDKLAFEGIPKGSSLLVAGGAGSGKTILCLQILNNVANKGEKALYISLEESEERLEEHMEEFGWDVKKLKRTEKIKIIRIDPFKIARQVEARLAHVKGELKMNVNEMNGLMPKGFKPQWVVIDSLTALSAAFEDASTNYRIYIEQLFRYLEKIGVNSLLISETEQMPTVYSKTGVEEFLADGVLVLYNLRHENIRENAIEILKLRGVAHEKKIVAMEINRRGIEIYPEQEIFSELKKNE